MLTSILRKIKAASKKAYTIVPRGDDLFSDIARSFPDYLPDIVIDVGANIGQTAVAFAQRFPGTDIYSIEPSPALFAELRANVSSYPRVRCQNLACGASPGFAYFCAGRNPTMGRLEIQPTLDVTARVAGAVQVEVTTIDAIRGRYNFERVGFLKVDTEGGDLDVLRGAGEMLSAALIDFVQVEAGMSRDNRYHIPMFDMFQFMEDKGYRIFGIYEQIPEWPTQQTFLRRSNLVFLSPKLFRQQTL